MSLILASQSKARTEMLRAAGLKFTALPADLDEASITSAALEGGAGPSEIAARLAAAKALHIAGENPGALIIGADQVLEYDGQLLSKAASPEDAKAKLQNLCGKTHHLISAVCVAKNDEILWQAAQSAAADHA